ncbi:MAG TPA: HAMP domain-containing sensor histidine kinase [Rhodocyclaceae bacterium]|nr:HAMP domain-containing sensor histidine kinase [Rhodocyclaceae bacterium]
MDSLVAAAIHDAKNALNALGAALDEAGREHPSPALERARAMAARISSQLVELLALHRHDQGILRLAVDDHDLADFLQDTLAELERPEGIAVSCDDAQARRIGAWAFDAYQVKFVLLDALRNGLRHAGSNVRLAVAAEPGGGIRFTVADDGPGFPPEVLAGETSPMAAQSSGLGLVFARLIAEQHATPNGRRGRIELANDGGARFSLVLP